MNSFISCIILKAAQMNAWWVRTLTLTSWKKQKKLLCESWRTVDPNTVTRWLKMFSLDYQAWLDRSKSIDSGVELQAIEANTANNTRGVSDDPNISHLRQYLLNLLNCASCCEKFAKFWLDDLSKSTCLT